MFILLIMVGTLMLILTGCSYYLYRRFGKGMTHEEMREEERQKDREHFARKPPKEEVDRLEKLFLEGEDDASETARKARLKEAELKRARDNNDTDRIPDLEKEAKELRESAKTKYKDYMFACEEIKKHKVIIGGRIWGDVD